MLSKVKVKITKNSFYKNFYLAKKNNGKGVRCIFLFKINQKGLSLLDVSFSKNLQKKIQKIFS
jgi:hypothetical protein